MFKTLIPLLFIMSTPAFALTTPEPEVTNPTAAFTLESAADMAAAHPLTFLVPDEAARLNAPVGAGVKLLFLPTNGETGERCWVRITERHGPSAACRKLRRPTSVRYVGEFAHPIAGSWLPERGLGLVVEFGPEHIADLDDSEPERLKQSVAAFATMPTPILSDDDEPSDEHKELGRALGSAIAACKRLGQPILGFSDGDDTAIVIYPRKPEHATAIQMMLAGVMSDDATLELMTSVAMANTKHDMASKVDALFAHANDKCGQAFGAMFTPNPPINPVSAAPATHDGSVTITEPELDVGTTAEVLEPSNA